MMKRFLLFLIAFLMVFPVFADIETGTERNGNASKALASDKFTIKGYKVKEDGKIEFVVVDSINESLNTFDMEGGTGNQDYVSLTSHLEDLVGTVTASNDPSKEGVLAESAEQLVFSFRLSGSNSGNYDICFVVDDFDGMDASNIGEVIGAQYEMSNLNFVFTNSKDGSNRVGDYSNTGRQVIHSVAVIDGNGTPSDKTLRQPLNINNASSSDYWIFRGAVFLSISEEDYMNAKLGNYSTTVRATLTQL